MMQASVAGRYSPRSRLDKAPRRPPPAVEPRWPLLAIGVSTVGHVLVALGAAIPAVVGYNYFVGKLRHWATEMDNFALELANLAERRLVRAVKSL